MKRKNYYNKTILNKITCVIRTLTCAGALLGTPVELSTIDMRVEVLIIVSDVAVDLLMDRLTDITRIRRTEVSVDVSAGVNMNAFEGVMTTFEFTVPDSSKEFCC